MNTVTYIKRRNRILWELRALNKVLDRLPRYGATRSEYLRMVRISTAQLENLDETFKASRRNA